MKGPLTSGDASSLHGGQTLSESKQGTPLLKVAAAIVALGALIALGKFAGGYVEPFAQRVDELGIWGPAAFIAAYIVAVIAFVPASLLTLGAGAIFGIGSGVIYVFFGASLGSGLAFLISRYLARSVVEGRLRAQPKFAAIDHAVGEQGRKIVFLLRLTPIIPFNLINYALGLTRVRFADYMLASFGMLPGTLLYVYSGKIAGDVATLAGNPSVAKGAGYYSLMALGLVATIAVTTIVTRIARRALEEATGDSRPDSDTVFS
jgi:uncharacterized membrane protein YdjX (TVP38/TMEM64 family)